MKKQIELMVVDFVDKYSKEKGIDFWRKPIVGFADVNHPYIQNLKESVGPNHVMPKEVLEDASIVICVFVPFTKEVERTNIIKENLASHEWAVAYEDTNAMFPKLNEYIIAELEKLGYKGATTAAASTFDMQELKSNWSYRHFAYAAGLGTFGVNNMLITKKGGCGRYTTVITNLEVEPDSPLTNDNCLYKKNGTCLICAKNCPAKAIDENGKYDRKKCYSQCLKNAEVHVGLGNSYVDKDGKPNSSGSDVCGKCTVYTPCAYKE